MYRSRSSSGSRQSFGPLRVSKNGPDSEKKSKGPLEVLNTNRRSSSASSARKSMVARPSSVQKRQRTSTSGFRNSRRSSARGYEHIKDPRPITDKGYKEKCIRLLIEFLTENSYPHPVTPKSLQSPLSKDFVRIFEFLMTFTDPKYKIGPKFEEEIPRVLKAHGYPFIISKTSMYSVGSPHTWPTLLAALTWLREQISYSLAVDVEDILFPNADDCDGQFDPDNDASDKKLLFEYCEKTYAAYLDGEDNFQQFEDELALQLRNNGAGGDMEKLSHEVRQLQLELESLETQPDPLMQLQDTHSSLKLDCSKLQQFVNQLDQHQKQREQAKSLAETEKKNKDSELQATLAENEKKKRIFQTQEFTQADVLRINSEKQELMRQIESCEKENSSLDQQVWELEMKVNKQKEKIEVKYADYNKTCQMLQMIPVTAENAGGVDYELSCANGNENKFIMTVKPSLMQVLNKWTDSANETGERLINEKEAYERLEEMIAQRQDSHDMLTSQIKLIEEQIESKKETNQQEIRKLQLEIDSMHEQLSELRRKEIQTLEEAKRKLQEEEARFKASKRARLESEQRFSTFIERALDMLITHKEKIMTRVSEVQQNFEKMVTEEKRS